MGGKITFKLNSTIADSYSYILLLKNWINNINNDYSKTIKTKLIYKLSKDGD